MIEISMGARLFDECVFLPYTNAHDSLMEWADECLPQISAQYSDLWGRDVVFELDYVSDHSPLFILEDGEEIEEEDLPGEFLAEADICGDGKVDFFFDNYAAD